MSKRTIFTVIGVFLLLLVGWSYHRSTPPDKTSDGSRANHGRGGSMGSGGSVPVVAGKAEQKDVPIYLDGLGTVQAFNTVTVHTRVDGQLQQVLFSEGQDVKTGELLAIVDPRPFQAALDQAVAKKAQDLEAAINVAGGFLRQLSVA
jgi:membrane fusion protein, multidrug efflux system